MQLSSPLDQERCPAMSPLLNAAGTSAEKALAKALSEAVQFDPNEAHRLSVLGHCLEPMGRWIKPAMIEAAATLKPQDPHGQPGLP